MIFTPCHHYITGESKLKSMNLHSKLVTYSKESKFDSVFWPLGGANASFRSLWYQKRDTKHVQVQCEMRKSFLPVTSLTRKRNIRCCFKKLIRTRLDWNSKEVKITSSCVSRQQLPNVFKCISKFLEIFGNFWKSLDECQFRKLKNRMAEIEIVVLIPLIFNLLKWN